MISYKDQTFCHDWCKNEKCFRNYKHILDAKQPGGFLHENEWMPVCYFLVPPEDCNECINP